MDKTRQDFLHIVINENSVFYNLENVLITAETQMRLCLQVEFFG